MAAKEKPISPTTPASSVENELDALNAEFHSQRNAPQLHRRQMEDSIEAQAKKRRSEEAPASSKFKPQG